MSGSPVVQQDATVSCRHTPISRATPTEVEQRVTVGGKPVVPTTGGWLVHGCLKSPYPCLTATWQSGSTRVTTLGRPIVIEDGTSFTDQESTLTVTTSQSRVTVL